ncbi:MAG TPA: Co2+/Mg2+ efflux protein ApaG [Acetobacteraceae bacterium]|jgi:ApaG protein
MSDDDPKANRPAGPQDPRSARQRRTTAPTREDYSKITREVRVSVRSFYLSDQSQPEENHFVWAYRVKIENQGREPVQLLRRTWRITDARGRTQHVHGAGVVGEQPLLEPGESFEYTSGTPLDTPSGFMVGAYHMVVPSSGEVFDVAIPAFSLDSPHQSGRVH